MTDMKQTEKRDLDSESNWTGFIVFGLILSGVGILLLPFIFPFLSGIDPLKGQPKYDRSMGNTVDNHSPSGYND